MNSTLGLVVGKESCAKSDSISFKMATFLSLIPNVSRQDFKLILKEGLSTLTLRETSLMTAVRHAGPEHARLRKHAMGMLDRPGLYLWTRWLMARWKQRRQMTIDTANGE